jgi:hypothetical protein
MTAFRQVEICFGCPLLADLFRCRPSSVRNPGFCWLAIAVGGEAPLRRSSVTLSHPGSASFIALVRFEPFLHHSNLQDVEEVS